MGSFEFDFDATFGPDYRHFHADLLDEECSNQETAEIAQLLELRPGTRVLDAPCGHGRIANRLASAGVEVVGVDAQSAYLDEARADAETRGVEVEYVEGDLRRLPVDGLFDAVLCWNNSFGYFDDDDNREVLGEFARVLRPAGTLLVEALHHDGFVRHFTASPDATVVERGSDAMVDVTTFDPATGCLQTARTVFRGSSVRRSTHFVRLPTAPEWRAWLEAAGFSEVVVRDRAGGPLTVNSWNLVVLATL
ncbi:MAG TPA: methyltransferase domain-containing protein [Acidimicrobiales bacterium]|nr:methyltransferase domain-containing protein [Acidimicrobiales bacterium]